VKRARPADSTQLVDVCRRVLREEVASVLAVLADHRAATAAGVYLTDLTALDSVPARHRYARRELFGRVDGLAQLTAANLVDHVRATEQLLFGELPVYAHNSLARVVVEAALRIRYLLASEIDVGRRLLRGAAMLLQSAMEDVRAVSEMRPHIQDLPRGRRRVERECQELRTVIARAGLAERTGSRAPTGLSWSATGEVESCTINVTGLAKEYLGHLPAVYRIMSGAPHSGAWLLDDMAKGGTRRSPQVCANPVDVAGTVDVVLASCVLLTETQARFDGHDPVPPKLANKSRRQELAEAIEAFAARNSALRRRRIP
jgi:hypothetical protein